MSNLKLHKAKGYGKTTKPELDSVYTFQSAINTSFVKPDIKTQDKLPNIDGYLELTDENGDVKGKLEVQIKTLSAKHISKPKYQTPVDFLAYCNDSFTPILLIVANKSHNKVFWIHISKDLLKTIYPNIKGKSVNIDIPVENCILPNEINYISKWQSIVDQYRSNFENFEKINVENNKLKTLVKKLEKNIINGKIDPKICSEIHRYLDLLNNSLENEFKVIKQFFYKGVWKIGLIYTKYTDNELNYMLYPILLSENKLLIRKAKEQFDPHRNEKAIGYYYSAVNNIIKDSPQKQVNRFLKDKLEYIIRNRVFMISNSFLAQEFLFEFITQYRLLLGLDKKHSYTVAELEYGFEQFLPLWLDEYFKKYPTKHSMEFSLDSIYLADTEKEKIALKIKNKLLKNEKLGSGKEYNIESAQFSFTYLNGSIALLKKIGITEIISPYILPKELEKERFWIFEQYSHEDLRNNLETLYKYLPKIYDQLIDRYFPLLKEKLKFFNDYDKLVIVLKSNVFSEDSSLIELSPTFFYLKNITETKEETVEVLLNETYEGLTIKGVHSIVEIDNSKYQLVGKKIAGYNYSKMPMNELVYETLLNKIKELFKE